MNRKAFFDAVRSAPLGRLTQTHVDALNVILDDAAARRWSLPYIAYVLATTHWETARTFRWDIREFGRGKGRAYGKPAGPFGLVYYGRSWPQLTWHENYVKQGNKLGIALDRDPDLMVTRPIAAKVLLGGMEDGDFTGKALRHYLDGPEPSFVEARRIVNGVDHKYDIARLADGYLAALQKAVATVAPVPLPRPTPKANPDTRKDAAGKVATGAGGAEAVAGPQVAPDAAGASLALYGGLFVLAIGLTYLAWRNRRWISVHLSLATDAIGAKLQKL